MRTATCAAVAVVLLAVSLLIAGPAWADSGYEDDDLSLRLASAFERFTEVSAFGGETVANRWSPAINPASAAWPDLDRRLGLVGAGYFSRVACEEGTDIDVYGESVLWDTRRIGALHLTLSQVRSNRATTKSGLDFDYDTDTVQFLWAERWGRVGAGLSVNYATSEVEQTVQGQTMSRSTAETWRLRAGLLAEPWCGWVVGVAAEYAWSPFEYEALVPTPMGLVPVSGDDTQENKIARVGISYEYMPLSTVSLDWQWASFENDIGRLTTGRFTLTAQQQAWQFLFLRAGLTLDDRDNLGFFAGFSAALGPAVFLEFGYQSGTMPELVPDFGESDVFQLALSLRL